MEHPQILNLTEHGLQHELKIVLAKIRALYGIKSEITGEMLVMMQLFLLKYYRTITLAEILTAAELNLAGQFPQKIEHYGQVDQTFITSLINTYRSRKMAAFIEFKNKSGTSTPPDQKKPATGQESYSGLKDFVEQYGELPIGWDWSGVFEHMWKEKLFKDSPEQMKEWFEKESTRLMADYEMKLTTASSLIERRSIEALMLPDAIKAECRKIYICQLFAPLVKPEPDNVEVINPGDQLSLDIGQLAIQWSREFEKGKDDQGFINYNGYDLSREDFIQTKLNEMQSPTL